MPHLVLEHTPNIAEKTNLHKLFQELHHVLATDLPTAIHNCKSRTLEHSTYLVGTKTTPSGFIHLNIKILAGREAETLENLGRKLMNVLTTFFSHSLKTLGVSITLEIEELKTYVKSTG